MRRAQPTTPSPDRQPPAEQRQPPANAASTKELPVVRPEDWHHLQCPHRELVTFWKDPTPADLAYVTPYADAAGDEKYVTFEPDVGGWNNIRMQMELVLVLAFATGRTLVLPPDQPMYLLNAGQKHQKAHGFDDFFPFQYIRKRMKVISMEDFLRQEAVTGRLRRHLGDGRHSDVYNVDKSSEEPKLKPKPKPKPKPGPQQQQQQQHQQHHRRLSVEEDADGTLWENGARKGETLYPPQNKTVFVNTERDERLALWDYLRNVSAAPKWQTMTEFVVIPPRPGLNTSTDASLTAAERDAYRAQLDDFAADRSAVFYDDYWHRQRVIHFVSKPGAGYRLLEHFYTYLHFQDARMDRYFKRFVRDFVHYQDEIFCKAALIIDRLLAEGNGSYVAFHIRRGEFQYKVVKISGDQILENNARYLPRDALAYVASDERNQTFFEPFKKYFTNGVRFLNDFDELAGLRSINPNYLGMIDQVICSRADRRFVGTWFSTFSGYITRMRGYLGYADETVVYGDKEHRDRFQQHEHFKFPFYMREWREAWDHIDEA